MLPHTRSLVIAAVAATAFGACSKDQPAQDKRVASAAASGVAAVAGQKKIPITAGTATFLIDAPLEKIKGRSGNVRGAVNIDPQNLKACTGQIEVDLDDLRTETFQDDNKNKTQTEHAKNWLEIGPDVDAKRHEENRWARFTFRSIQEASAVKLASAGDQAITLQANGELSLHGTAAPKTVAASVTFSGPPEAPTSVHIVTTQPITVSLKQHDVKPRDLAGKFISGALEKIGQKIDDTVQISLDLTGS